MFKMLKALMSLLVNLIFFWSENFAKYCEFFFRANSKQNGTCLFNDKAKLTGWNSEDYNNPPAAKLKYPKIVKGAFRHLKPVGMFKEHWVLFLLKSKRVSFLAAALGQNAWIRSFD